MTKTIAIALVAIAGFAGAASAGSITSVTKAQNLLDDHGFSVNANDLSDNQLAEFHFIDDGADVADASLRAQIRSILRK
ncbi:MAG: hypothetical protein AAGF55_11710 [Pseudomonadota bacterium]